SCIFHTASATATTATLDMRNNVLVNLSAHPAPGLRVAYRRSGTALNNYASTSNNNLFYSGSPADGHLIFNDGTNSDEFLANYKVRVAPRDSASVTEFPPFLSATGSSPNFLHIDPTIA